MAVQVVKKKVQLIAKDQEVKKPEPVSVSKGSKVSESDEIIKAIQKTKGAGTVVAGNTIPTVTRIPTGLFEWDLATGGGFPRGRYSIVYGPESSGKTNICYMAIAQAQKLPPPCNKAVLVDVEGTFDATWAAEFGVDTEKLILVKPAYGEEAVDIIDALVRAEDIAIIVTDSVAALISIREVDGSVEKADVGAASLLVRRLTNKVVVGLSEESKRGHHPALIFINQTRFKIGVMFGDPETMPGGQALKFYSSLTVRIYGKNKMEKSISSTLPMYKETSAIIKKAKVGVTSYNFNYDMCILETHDMKIGATNSVNMVLNFLKEFNLLTKNPHGWELLGEMYKTQDLIKTRYIYEEDYRLELQNIVIKETSKKVMLVGE